MKWVSGEANKTDIITNNNAVPVFDMTQTVQYDQLCHDWYNLTLSDLT